MNKLGVSFRTLCHPSQLPLGWQLARQGPVQVELASERACEALPFVPSLFGCLKRNQKETARYGEHHGQWVRAKGCPNRLWFRWLSGSQYGASQKQHLPLGNLAVMGYLNHRHVLDSGPW